MNQATRNIVRVNADLLAFIQDQTQRLLDADGGARCQWRL